MINFTKLNIQGFCSIQELELTLNTGIITIIKGKNGAGKSTILNALVWAIYGKTLKESPKVNIKPTYKGYPGTKVEIWLNKDQDIHHIIRCQEYEPKIEGSKGKNRVCYYINGDLVLDKGKNNIQKLIETNLGISYQLFKNSVSFGQKLKRIAQESGPDKKDLFEEAFEVGYISQAKEIANGYKKTTQMEYNSIQSIVQTTEKAFEEARDDYKDLYAREKNFREIQKAEILELKQDITKKEKEIKTLKPQSLKSARDKYNKKIGQLEKKLTDLKQIYQEKKSEMGNYTSEEGLSKLIDDMIGFMEERKYQIAYKKLVGLKSYFVFLDLYLNKKEAYQSKIYSLEKKAREVKEKESRITSLEREVTRITKEVEKVKNEKQLVISTSFKKKRVDLKYKLIEQKEKLHKTKTQLDNYTWLINDPLSNAGIKAFIFNSSLDLLNQCLDNYSKVIGFQITFGVDMESVKKDMLLSISKDDIIFNYEELSGGEAQLVDLAMVFAIHEITTMSKGINLLWLDELFESLDKENIELVIELVKYISENKSLFIITHLENFYTSNSKEMRLTKGDDGITLVS